jgi:hypothetical protein
MFECRPRSRLAPVFAYLTRYRCRKFPRGHKRGEELERTDLCPRVAGTIAGSH